MTHGGYRGDRDEWPPQRPGQTSPDSRYDSDPGAGGRPPQPGAAHDEADAPGAAVPYAGGAPWYGQQPAGPSYGRPEPSYERYPDAYVVEADGFVPGRREPSTPHGNGPPNRPDPGPSRRPDDTLPPMSVPPRSDPRLDVPRGRLADLRPFAPDGRLRRFAPDGSPMTGQLGVAPSGVGRPGAGPIGAGPDVRNTGQMPIFGPDTRTTGEQRWSDAGARQTPRPTGPPPRAFGAGPQQAAPPTHTFGPPPRDNGSQPRFYDTDPRTTGSQPRFYDPDAGTTGSQTRLYDADPYATGGLPGVPADKPPRRRGRVAVAVLASLAVLAALGFAGVTLLRHRSSTANAGATSATKPSINTAAITDRTVDPTLLTTAEVFGAGTIASKAPAGTYRIIRSQSDASCGTAATAAISTLLASLGCNQAVRATMLSPDQAYVITAGVLNLPNTASATKVAGSLQSDITKGTGRLNGLDAGGTTTVITSAQAQVAWDTRGHYLVYSIIALTSGKAIAASDKQVPAIITDVVENYLGDKVLGARADRSAAPTPTSS
jgi:hypothetical protein